MQRGTGMRDDLFGFGGAFPLFGGFGGLRRLSSGFLGGRGPFDDPFFSDPFFSDPLRNSMGASIFESDMFHVNPYSLNAMTSSEFLEGHPVRHHRPSRPIIQEISDDDEGNEDTEGNKVGTEELHRSGKEPHVEVPNEADGVNEHKSHRNEIPLASGGQSQPSKYTFHSSTVTYGGINGAYYSASTIRRMVNDGVVMEERKEANTTSGKATHRISRGIHDKGHSVTRKLDSDGRVDTMQALHNINEDEMPGFEAAWKGNAGQFLMRRNPGIGMRDYKITRGKSSQGGRASRVIDIEVLPSTKEQIEISRS